MVSFVGASSSCQPLRREFVSMSSIETFELNLSKTSKRNWRKKQNVHSEHIESMIRLACNTNVIKICRLLHSTSSWQYAMCVCVWYNKCIYGTVRFRFGWIHESCFGCVYCVAITTVWIEWPRILKQERMRTLYTLKCGSDVLYRVFFLLRWASCRYETHEYVTLTFPFDFLINLHDYSYKKGIYVAVSEYCLHENRFFSLI